MAPKVKYLGEALENTGTLTEGEQVNDDEFIEHGTASEFIVIANREGFDRDVANQDRNDDDT